MWNPIGLIKWNKWVAWENSPLKPFIELMQETLNYLESSKSMYQLFCGGLAYRALEDLYGIKWWEKKPRVHKSYGFRLQ